MSQKRLDLSKAGAIGGSSLVRMARDRTGLIATLLMPMILIAVLGAALSGVFSSNSITPFTVAILSTNQPAKPSMPQLGALTLFMPSYQFGSVLVKDVFGSKDVKRVILTKRVRSAAEGERMVRSGNAAAFVQVPSDFSARALSGRTAKVRVLTDPGKETLSGIAVQIVGSFTDSLTAGIAAGKVLGPQGAQALADATRANWTPTVRRVTTTARDVRAIQYYAAAMSIMFMTMTAFNRGGNVLRERELGTLQRTLTSPTSKVTVLAGHALGSMAILLCQFLILMLGTRLLYGVSWGAYAGNWLASLGIGVAFAFAATGLGLGVASIFNDVKASQGSVGLLSNLMSALSGSMLPIYQFPAYLRTAAKFVPAYWALQGITDQMGGLTAAHMLTPVVVLAAVGLVFGGVGVSRLAAR